MRIDVLSKEGSKENLKLSLIEKIFSTCGIMGSCHTGFSDNYYSLKSSKKK